MATTLEQAINAETATTAGQKTTQLAFLSAASKALEQTDLETIISGDHDGATGLSLDNLHEVRELIQWRIENDLPILPFTGLTLGTNFVVF